jgi:Ca-activated chloride channel family protein
LSRSLVGLGRAQRWLATTLRVILVFTLALSLGRPTSTEIGSEICTVFLIDVSESVSDETLESFRLLLERSVRARGSNILRGVAFARRAREFTIPGGLGSGEHLARFDRFTTPDTGTDIAAGLTLAYGLFPSGVVRRVVVFSDGLQTDGDVLAEAARAAMFGVEISVVPSRIAAPGEVALQGLRLPERIHLNEPFDLRATVFASRAQRATLTLTQGESLNGLDGTRTLELLPGVNEVRFRSVVRVAGDVTFALRVTGVREDRFSDNNRYVATAHVPGPPAVLYIEGDETHSQYFREALSGGDFDLEVRSAREVPQSAREMERFDFIVLSDVGADRVSQGTQAALASYVRDLGGGFMMAGGPRSFGLGGWQGGEVERLLPVRLESERRREQPSVALSLVIDRSGSMQGTPLMLAQSAALAAARALGPDDLIEVIAFDSDAERVVRMQSARNRVRIENELRRLRSGGGTAIFPAIDAAAQDLAVTRATTRHVILLTDGEGQPDEPPRVHTVVDAMFGDGVTVSTVGLGASVNRPLLEGIAQRGHGRSYFTTDAGSLPQIFLRETNLVARSAAVEEPLQPRVVSQASFLRELGGVPPYLYGYVSTRLKPEPAQLLIETDGSNPEPLLARWRVGLGWSLAWTSDLKNRWAVDWVRWPRWAPFWTQLVREHMRQRQRHELGLRAEMVAGVAHVSVDAITDRDRFDNGLVSELTLRGPLPAVLEERVAMRQIAPGRYEADIPLSRYGVFGLRAVHRRDGRVVAESRGEVNNPYPREYATVVPDLALLEALARSTGGRVDPSPRALGDSGGAVVRRSRPLWKWPVGAAVVLLLLDVLLRRVRLFDRQFRAR